jgi:hypothetical protein
VCSHCRCSGFCAQAVLWVCSSMRASVSLLGGSECTALPVTVLSHTSGSTSGLQLLSGWVRLAVPVSETMCEHL